MKSKETTNQKGSFVVVANEILSSGRFQECSVEEALEHRAKPTLSASATINCSSTTINSHSKSAQEANGGQKNHESLRSFWIDTEILGTPDLTCLPDNVLNVIPPFVKQHLMQASQLTTPQTVVLPESVLIVFPILSSTTASLAGEKCCAIICLENLLLTIVAPAASSVDTCSSSNNDNPRPPTSIFQRLDMTRTVFYQYQLPQANTTAVLCALLRVQASRVSHVMEQIRSETVKQYALMRQDVDSVNKSDIMNLVDKLLEIQSVADEQCQVFTILHNDQAIAGGTLDCKTLHPYSKALLATSSATKRSAATLEKIQLHVYKMYNSRLQERANHRLNLLTVFNAVFLPITLLAGIWGMNFINMPELETENGYYFALGTMAAIAFSLTFGFWQSGWFNMS